MEAIKPIEYKAKDNHILRGYNPGDLSQARAIIILVHGLGEHVRRYDHVAELVTDRGMAGIGIDQRGFGISGKKSGVIGSSDALMADISIMIAEAKKANPIAPIFLYGHSMGALEALYYGLKSQESVQGIIATSPALDPDIMSKAQKKLLKLLKPILPNLAIDNGLDVEALSRDPQVVQRYRDDPLVHPKASVTLAAFMQDGAQYVMSQAEEWAVPLYLAHGSADRICPVQGSRQFASKLGEKVTYQEWEGLYHETHNEPEQEQVLATMLDWLESRV